MMYNQKLAVAIKTNGKVLREFKDTVYVPFGSEYSILIKNLNTVRALININIDGNEVVPGGLVLYGSQEIDLQRWIKNGNLNEGNCFKFIERTEGIEKHRGVKLEDGIVRIEYQFERPYVAPSINWNDVYYKGNWTNDSWSEPTYKSKGIVRGMSASYSANGAVGANSAIPMNATVGSMSASLGNTPIGSAQSLNDAGITVPGSKSDQKFSTASWFPTEAEKHVMILKLLGETLDNKPILEPVTVKAKPRCETCGHTNKATAQYCNKCGTALTIYA